jgi:LAO/AO transport system kinase
MSAHKSSAEIKELFKDAQNGDVRLLGKALSILEDDDVGARELDQLSLQYANDGYVIGVTGPPGAGKSSLVDLLIGFSSQSSPKERVAVVAVDPSSPFSGGAILGDRVRMQQHGFDKHVFIRSFASRGLTGGLSLAARRAVRLFIACGYRRVYIETVGVGQIELDIARAADTVIVVMVPNSGDEVQVAKAGITEIADIFAVNKSDLPGADSLTRQLIYEIEAARKDISPFIIPTSALKGEGLEELWAAIAEHQAMLEESGNFVKNRGQQRISETLTCASDEIRRVLASRVSDELSERIIAGTIDPASAADELVTLLAKE